MFRRIAIKYRHFGQGDLNGNPVNSTRVPQENLDSVKFPRNRHQSQTVKIGIDSSPPRRMKPALPTGIQGEEGTITSKIGVPPPLFGRLGASGELGSLRKMIESHSTTRPPREYSGANLNHLYWVRLRCLRSSSRPGSESRTTSSEGSLIFTAALDLSKATQLTVRAR